MQELTLYSEGFMTMIQAGLRQVQLVWVLPCGQDT